VKYAPSLSGHRASTLLRIAMALAWIVFPAICLAADSIPRSVLVLSQGFSGAPWPSAVQQAIRSVVNDGNSAAPTSIYVEELDLAHFGGPQYEALLRSYLLGKYQNRPVGVIVTVGSDALDFVLRLRAEIWTKIPVVFAAVDEQTATRLTYPSDATGSTMRLSFLDAVAAARVLVPNFRRIVLVGNPLEGNPYRRQIIGEFPQYTMGLEFVNASALTMTEIRTRVSSLPDDAAIYYTGIYVDAAGVTYAPLDALAMVAQVANRPIIVDAETSIGRGVAGGFVLDPVAVGRDAARRVLRILDGENVSSIPIVAGNFAKPVFDWRELKRWSIKESWLPAGSEVRFRPATLWEQYRSQMAIIVAAILGQALMITWLLLERRRRRMVEFQSRGRLRDMIHLERVAAVGAMSASIAHELNQPLGAILADAQTAELLLATDPIDLGQIKEILADICSSDQRAGGIIAHMRGLLKTQSEFEFRDFDLNDALREALHTLEPEARRRGVLVSTYLAEDALRVRADPVHMEQVILNLAMNAMDAMETCAPGTRKLRLQSAFAGESEVEVSVCDSGIGIPKEKLKGVFDTFYTTKKAGTGLGLSIVRTIVETSGGRVWAENQSGGGSAFRFTLPRIRAH
jgi:signal transduction histidine kinase